MSTKTESRKSGARKAAPIRPEPGVTKQQQVIELQRHPGGATAKKIMDATG